MAIFALPAGRKNSKQLLYDVASSHVDVGLKSRQFIDIFKGVVIYINEIDNETKMLSDVFIEDRRTEKINSTVLAHEGQLTYDPELAVANLRLFNGTIHQVDLVEKHANAIKFETYDLRLDMSSNLPAFDKGKEHVQEMSLSKLRQTIRSASKKDGAYFKALKEYHKKFSLPGASLVMALLAMPLGIRARNSKRAYGIGLGLFFFLLYYVTYSTGKKRLAFITSNLFLFLAVFSVAIAFHKYNLSKKDKPAIVFAQETVIKSEPNKRSQELFRLHEGTKVQIIDTVNQWKEIKLADGKIGWIENEDIKEL